jgi:hypothetical protein
MSVYSSNSPGLKASIFVILWALILPFALTFLMLLGSPHGLLWKVPMIVAALTLPPTTLLLAQLTCVRIKIEDDQLVVGGGHYKEIINLSDIDRSVTHKVNLAEAPGLPGFRVNGIALPAFKLGWFQPYRGKKLFVLISEQQAVFVPTSKEYDLLVSSPDADRLLIDLHAPTNGIPVPSAAR